MKKEKAMSKEEELAEALTTLENTNKISKDILIDAIKQSLIQACSHNWKSDASNVVVNVDPTTYKIEVYAEKVVTEQAEDKLAQISLADAKMIDPRYELGDVVRVEIKTKEFGRIATQNAKNVILQKIREEERKALYKEYYEKEHDVVTGVVQRYFGRNVSISLDSNGSDLSRVDATLSSEEMIRGEIYRPTQRIKVYVLDVHETPKGPKIQVSRTHPELVKLLFEEVVKEIHDGIVEIRSIAREAGSRTKIAVWSNDPAVDPVSACVGRNGERVNVVVNELNGEKIDVISWDDNPEKLIENALSPAKVIYVDAEPDEKTAEVVVPDFQLSLAIGKEGQNARLAARLTGYKIDIMNETQALETGVLEYAQDNYDDEGYFEDAYDQDGYEYDEYPEDAGYDEYSGNDEYGEYPEEDYGNDLDAGNQYNGNEDYSEDNYYENGEFEDSYENNSPEEEDYGNSWNPGNDITSGDEVI